MHAADDAFRSEGAALEGSSGEMRIPVIAQRAPYIRPLPR